MTEGKLTFATLVATPTKTAWSQAYTAGKLFAVLSLEQETAEKDLAATGKEVINALVEEYFTLETKNLDTIKAAVIQTTKKIPPSLTASFVVVSLVDTIVYAYSYGSGKILLKRHDRVGSILRTASVQQDPTVHAVSGYVEHNDSLVLETKQFADLIQSSDFATSFGTPAEAVEMLSPKVHGQENGAASAIVLLYQKEENPASLAFAPDAFEKDDEIEEKQEEIKSPLEEEVIQKKEQQQEEKEEREEREKHDPYMPTRQKKSWFPKISFRFPFKFLLLLLIPLILLGALGYGLYTTKQRQEESKVQKLFDDIYPQAQKQYDEGQSLLSLNKQLALDDFTKAKKIIDDNIGKFPQGSSQRQKMEDLLTKMEQQGVGGSPSQAASLPSQKASESDSPLLAALLKNKKATYATSSDNTIYVGSNADIETSSGKTLIENKDDWKSLAGLGAFNSNIYVLDKGGNQILKYLGGSQSSKSVYASGSFGNAVSMAIDSSIYVLSSDGSVAKYTRGSKDTFSVSGLTTPLSNATRIFTNATTDNVYILDKGNKRVVTLSKTGTFGKAYTADVFGSAIDFDVHEKDKKIFVFSSGSIYEVDMP